MKHLLFVIMLLTAATQQASGQDNIAEQVLKSAKLPPEQRAAQMTDMMQKQLHLTPAQLPTIREINLRYAHRMEREVNKANINLLTRYWRANTIMSEKDKELARILNAAQMKRYRDIEDLVFDAMWKQYF